MLRELQVRHYGCVREARLLLTPLHALIGPNDSGKSTLLSAARTVCRAVGRQPFPDVRINRKESGFSLHATGADGSDYVLARDDSGELLERWRTDGGSESEQRFELHKKEPPGMASVARARLLRLDPDYLRKPSAPIQLGESIDFLNERGEGLAGVYDAILSTDAVRFVEIQTRVCRLFPALQRIGVPQSGQHRVFEFATADGKRLTPAEVSEGLLYYLAFEALRYLDPVAVLCIEEPENGLHPRRIKEVLGILRHISEQGTQVLLATHSPLVVNELEPSEVTLVVRPHGEGTRAVPMTATRNFRRRAQVYALGELWISYCDGELEAELTAADVPAEGDV